ASAERPPNAGAQDSVAPPSGVVPSQSLAPERCRLIASGLSDAVVATIQSARAVSTRALYTLKWRSFERWYFLHSVLRASDLCIPWPENDVYDKCVHWCIHVMLHMKHSRVVSYRRRITILAAYDKGCPVNMFTASGRMNLYE